MTIQDLLRIKQDGLWYSHYGCRWYNRNIGPAQFDRVRLVLVEGWSIADVAKSFGVSYSVVYLAVCKAERGGRILGLKGTQPLQNMQQSK